MKKFIIPIIILGIIGLGYRYITNTQKITTPELPVQNQEAIAYCQTHSGTVESYTTETGVQLSACRISRLLCEVGAWMSGECPRIEDTMTIKTTDRYIVKTKDNIGGDDIFIYDLSGTMIYSRTGNYDNESGTVRQRFYDITGDYLVTDQGTSFVRDMAIYDIANNEKLFETTYSSQNDYKNGLYIEGNKVFFLAIVAQNDERQIEKPTTLPICNSDRPKESIGYSQLRAFNLDTKQLENTDTIVCTFFE